MDKTAPSVAVLMGSDSDLAVMRKCAETLRSLGVAFEVSVLSAHRTPVEVDEYVKDAERRGVRVFIAAAGGAAHLAGALAARTVRPVIGVPMLSPALGGADALYSTVQMPGGVPVATVAIGEAGAVNAAILAAQMLALSDSAVEEKLREMRESQRRRVLEKNSRVRAEFRDDAQSLRSGQG
jgi:5-(carboxyamino)imidazole ribonucleotide mutase